ncbi:MAG: histidine kinase [Bacteroidota bacterium]
MKKYLTHYITQAIGVLLVQLPITASWLSGQPEKTDYILKWMVIGTISLFIERIPFVHLYNYLMTKQHKFLYFGLIASVIVVISPTIHIIVPTIIKYFIWHEGYEVVTWAKIVERTNSTFEAYLLFTVIYLVTYFWLEFQNQKEKALKASLLTNEAQLKMLQYQINPHFLFNTITSVLSLIDENKSKAKNVLMSLSEYFRFTLNNKKGETVELFKELEAVKKYLEIQKVRFEEKMEIEYNIDSKVDKLKVPFFILHPLVENAVKYGIKTSSSTLQIKIEIMLEESNNLQINVINSGKLLPEESEAKNTISTSTGIENLKRRLDIIYGDNASFSLVEEKGKVHASIHIKNIV